MAKLVRAADLFCGAGGSSSGLIRACEALGYRVDLTAVNHWKIAIETHAANHPWARHINKRIEQIRPESVVPGGKLDLLWASPECIYHSNARGGRGPCDDQSRGQAMLVLDWIDRLQPSTVIIENVPEFVKWGPLYRTGPRIGKPIPDKRGEQVGAWLKMLSAMNYRFAWRFLTCADYGDATSRRRFFLIARRGSQRIKWPAQTHAPRAEEQLFGQLKRWRPASEVIDWSIPGHSIFLTAEDVKAAGLGIRRPLRPNTIKRIEAGIRRFWGRWAEPFLIRLRGTSEGRIDGSPIRIDEPLPAITAGGGHIGLIRPFLTPFFGERDNQGPRTHAVDVPAPSVTSHGAGGIITPLVVQCMHGDFKGDYSRRSKLCSQPLQTITAGGNGFAVLQPWILNQDQRARDRDIGEPLSTIVTSCSHGFVSPFLVKYNGTGTVCRLDVPLQTVTSDDRFGLVRPIVVEAAGQRYLMDILFRMFTVRELAAAHSFPADYVFCGKKTEQVKQIGNSVPLETALALSSEALSA